MNELETQAFWYRVLQIALAELEVQSFGKAAEVSNLSYQELYILKEKIIRAWLAKGVNLDERT